MADQNDNLRRSSLRLEEFDYSQPGMYFVTLVTWQREYMFGQVANDEVIFNDIGLLARTEWNRLSDRFTGIELDYCVIMPNHIHGILAFSVGARREESPVASTYL